MSESWIGFDLDGTLADHSKQPGEEWTEGAIGRPIDLMVRRAKRYIEMGYDVRIFTARVGRGPGVTDEFIELQRNAIEAWCRKHLGRTLPVTAEKNYGMQLFFDDRAVTVKKDSGRAWWELTPTERLQEIAV